MTHGRFTRAAVAAVVVVSTLSWLSSACKKPDDDVTSALPPAASTAGKPVDHLAAGEIVEGSEHVWGVALPRDMDATKLIAPSYYGRVHAPPAAVLAYFQAHLSGGKVVKEPGGSFAIDQAHGSDPKLVLLVRIDRDDVGSRIEVKDVTPPAPELHGNDEERWKATGLKPSGAVDPTTLH